MASVLHYCDVFFLWMTLAQRGSTLFPYTTLFRSAELEGALGRPLEPPIPIDLLAEQVLGLDFLWEEVQPQHLLGQQIDREDRKSTRLNSSHITISYAVFCLKKKKK